MYMHADTHSLASGMYCCTARAQAVHACVPRVNCAYFAPLSGKTEQHLRFTQHVCVHVLYVIDIHEAECSCCMKYTGTSPRAHEDSHAIIMGFLS